MKLKDLKLNKRRYTRDGFAPTEFLVFKFIGIDWCVANNEAGKEVVLPAPNERDDVWKYFDNEIIIEDN